MALICFLIAFAIITYGTCIFGQFVGQLIRPVIFGKLISKMEVDAAMESFLKAHHERFASMFLLNGENPRNLKKFQKLERKEKFAWHYWNRLNNAYNWHEYGIDAKTVEP